MRDYLFKKLESSCFQVIASASILYLLFGICHTLSTNEVPFLYGYFLSSLLMIFVGIYYSRKEKNIKELSQLVFFKISLIALTNTFIFSFSSKSPEAHLWYNGLIFIASLEITWLMTMSYIIATYILATSFLSTYLYFYHFEFTTNSIFLIGSGVLYLIWKFINSITQNHSFQSEKKMSKIEALQGTITTLSHEFNNLTCVIYSCLEFSHVSENGPFKLLKSSLEKFLGTINKISKVKDYKEVTYVGDHKMLDIHSEE
jgi:hypothetical protein